MSTWLPTSGRKIPHTVVGGHDLQRNEDFLIGQAQYKGHTIPGRISRAKGCLYMSYDGDEIVSEKYNILLVYQPTQWAPESGAPDVPRCIAVRPLYRTSVVVSWKEPLPTEWKVYIQGYTVTYNRIDHRDPYKNYPKKTVTVKHGRTEVIIDKLEWYGKYEFHVKAYNSVGKSSDSVSVYVDFNEKQKQAEDKIDSSEKAEPEDSQKGKRKDTTKDAKAESIAGSLPEFLKNAVQGGTTYYGKPIFIARAKGPDGVFYPGRLGPDEKVCYMPFGGKEIARDRFEILKYATNEK